MPGKASAAPAANVAEFTVTELSMAIKRTMEDRFGYVRLRGEISGYRGRHASGHCYFALKDDKSKIEAVIWKGVFSNLAFKPEEGVEVIATGKITTFPGSSKYQIVVEALEPAGVGALMALLEERKKKLAAEGLFAEERKVPLPFLPQVIGIVTSPAGAVIRDMMHGFQERFPAHVIVWPVRVQGETCAAEVAAAIRGFNAMQPGGPVPRPDVLIVARGGGSIEDLWGFNEEIAVRAAAESEIPLISAVGHETDWTLIDLAADARAPTPTKAAEWAVPKHSELLAKTADIAARLRHAMVRQMENRRALLSGLARGLPRRQDLLALPRQRFDAAASRLERSLVSFAAASRSRFAVVAARLQKRLLHQRLAQAKDRLQALDVKLNGRFRHLVQKKHTDFARPAGRFHPGLLRNPAERARERLNVTMRRASLALRRVVDKERRRLENRTQLLNSLSYKNVLQRGFAIVRDGAGAMLRRANQAAEAVHLKIEFADGSVHAHTEGHVHPVTPAHKSQHVAPAQPAHSAKKRDTGQGQLF
jgi:exodeoxyribonuclease VII large subunit